jgi:hypothetical protein
MKIKRKINNKIVAAKRRAAAIKAADDPRTWAHNNPIKKDRGDYYEYIYTIDPNKLYYGCPGAYFISMGNNVEDPWIEWEGWLYNATDLEDALYNDFGEWMTQSTEAEAQTFDGGFEDWVTPDLVENVLYDLNPFAKVVYDKGNNHTARGVSPTEWFNDNMNIDAACGKKSIKSSRRKSVKAAVEGNLDVPTIKKQFPAFLDRVEAGLLRAFGDAYEYRDFTIDGTQFGGATDVDFEIILSHGHDYYADAGEVGSITIECYSDNDFPFIVYASDSDTVQAEGDSFNDIYETCVSELVRIAEDFVSSDEYAEYDEYHANDFS